MDDHPIYLNCVISVIELSKDNDGRILRVGLKSAAKSEKSTLR